MKKITSWNLCQGGAKNYGYATKHRKIVRKVHGFSLHVRDAKQLNYQIMKQNILDEILGPQDERRDTDIVNVRHFKCDPIAKKIKTETEVKKYGLVFDKRVLHIGTFKSYPYGYRICPVYRIRCTRHFKH